MKNIRNFSIISHIDHGKSTLADRMIEITGTVSSEKIGEQMLDSMDLERERGITIKMQPVRMKYSLNGEEYIINMIDTPGHVDFSYEVSRSLAAVEGVVLLVDATKGIQAQTLANLDFAKRQNLVIVPAVNKIDLPNAMTEDVSNNLAELLGIDSSEVIRISAKKNINVDKLLARVIEKIPAPKKVEGEDFKGLIFDSEYDSFKGVVAYVRVVSGSIKKGEKIYLLSVNAKGEVKEVGYFIPTFSPQNILNCGDIGYIATGIKEAGIIKIGDTISNNKEAKPLPGYKELNPVVFVSFYPEDTDDYNLLREALDRIRLTDPAITFEPEFKEVLGRGFRCGFLGSLHAEIISERLHREFNLDLVITSPSVVYKIIDGKGDEMTIMSPADWPNGSNIKQILEPWVRLEVMTPSVYIGGVMELLSSMGGKVIENKYFKGDKILVVYEVPLRKIITGFHDKIKGVTQGYASFNYSLIGLREGDLVKLEVLVGGNVEEVFSQIVDKKEAYNEGKKITEKLKELLPSQQFALAIQAAIYGKIIARETVKAQRKDVTAPLYGGDVTRKRKLLDKQKKGKKKLQERMGKIRVPPEVFFNVFKK
ncbi:MAG: Elongation factor 4 [Parcubacteria group bacterium ADurb.Bin247]|jgi:GTP-binding protein LepA|nr:MAG: Elongation factor 4 [Parcubacteria group bacterium ADurb.Bin247]HQB85322.1 translation elongation factor 4 [Candidatus Pacearchaeota archaeon]